MNTRWHLNRAGIINFWLYDEAEFEFSSGRLILRGANGAGKSVTMQSLIPLVLDGDKRPWRLDPFGSRDRRLEYYLLGEADSNIFERTGYLFLEFSQPEQQRYFTIGIGLRARRSSALNFWGFAITDNRRLGRDLLLYQRDFSHNEESRIPLTRIQLQEALGSGGWLVTEQGEYKRRINKELFGYHDLQSYQELLDLLLQIRSPKLSKDFKPSTIYEILASALPPLQEDDLRPLAEVLADMNEIGDRLHELVIHRQEVERLQKAYNHYNQQRLFTVSRALLAQGSELKARQKEEADLSQKIAALTEELAGQAASVQKLEQDQVAVRAQYEALSTSEALAKEQELERLHGELKEAESAWAMYRQRVADGEEGKRAGTERVTALAEDISTCQARQHDLLQMLTKAAAASNFSPHEPRPLLFQREIPTTDSFWPPWQRDIAQHEQQLEQALSLAREESRFEEQTAAAERELSAARQRRDQAEADLRQQEQALETAQQEVQQQIFAWRRRLQELPCPDPTLQELLQRLSCYPDRPYSDVHAVITNCRQQAMRELARLGAELAAEQNRHRNEKEELEAELKEWRQQKEPEPPRSPAREAARQRRRNRGETGLPLYAACDFQPQLAERTRAALESALETAGLLDAWISDGKLARLEPGEEECWIEPDPQLLTPTLADYLIPTPPAGNGCSADAVDLLLRTIRVHKAGGDTEAGYVDPDSGRYQLGCLLGQAAVKPQAQYIGKESRRRTRAAEMERLRTLIFQQEEALAALAGEQQALAQREDQLEMEIKAFPDGGNLISAQRALQKQEMLFDTAFEEEKRKFEYQRQLAAQLLQASTEFHQFMARWNIPHSEPAVEQALRQLRHYKDKFNELHHSWQKWLGLMDNKKQTEVHLLELQKRLDQDVALLAKWLQRQTELTAKITALTKLLRELGIYDLHAQLLQLKDEDLRLQAEIKNQQRVRHQIELSLTKENTRLENLARRTAEAEGLWQQKFSCWQREWNYRLLPEWFDRAAAAAQPPAVDRLCHTITQQYRRLDKQSADTITNRLLDEFYSVRQSLLPYVPELDSDPVSGRRRILFNRDRHNPLTPGSLLQELKGAEDEQRLLLSRKDRELYEEILIHSVGRAIKDKIARAEQWVTEMNRLMQARETSSGLKLFLRWEPMAATTEDELDTEQLVQLLRTDPYLLRDDQIDGMVQHFRTRIKRAETEAEAGETLRDWVTKLLDYRLWFRFTLYFSNHEKPRRELTDSRFNVLSGGEKAMAMYIPLLAAVCSRYSDADPIAPRIVSLDEAFAGVDDENLRDMFELLTQMDLDFIMTSQNLWGCYDTVPGLAIYELYRPQDAPCVSQIHYTWNGRQRKMMV